MFPFSTSTVTLHGEIGDVFITEEHGVMDPYELVQPPAKEGDQRQRHPKKAKIGPDRVRFSEEIWILLRLEELLQEGTEEEYAGDRLCYVLSEVYCPGFYSRFYLHWGIVGTL
jgi:hypothetical protein